RAVMRLFPGTQLAFGPPLENGFYYDIDSPTPITEADFPRIEEEMRKIVADAEPFERFERPTAEARELVRDLKQHYKVEHIDAYLRQVEEAKKRDHRVLGKQLKLFTISQAVGSGLILWMPKGAIVRGILESFIKDELLKRGYQPVYTPHIGRLELYRTSGHFPYYRDAQFPPMYARPAAGALDLCQYRLASGEVDEKKEQEIVDYLKQCHFVPPEYEKAATQQEK